MEKILINQFVGFQFTNQFLLTQYTSFEKSKSSSPFDPIFCLILRCGCVESFTIIQCVV